ncbi:MAG TPA: isoleucine--tRNA ligase [Rhodospirillaceae bacterium]|nr:isoleucine--tRNA ligase [Rhodospirillaceae bacterium]
MSVDYKSTVFLPKTDFPMKAGLAGKEPGIIEQWEQIGLYELLREDAKGRPPFVLHDGPPYANGNLHIGHALNKILKDVIVRAQQMMGKDANYVPGWDCHGLPIEWKIEEQYRAQGKDKDQVPVVEFRQECRDFAQHWIGVQRDEFKRLGVIGDWADPYTTMSFGAEAQIARELLKFLDNGLLYRGSKPVMWSVVEKTALAEAEVEYHDHESDTIWVKFPVVSGDDALADASVVIWTTTPWTIPGNRAVCFSNRISYGLYEITEAPEDNWAKTGDKLILADALAEDVFKSARVDGHVRVCNVAAETLAGLTCAHPFRGMGDHGGYDFDVPLLDGDHVTDETGTGFVHTAPGHGREDFEAWMSSGKLLAERGIDSHIPYTVDADGRFTPEAPGFEGAQVITDKGKKGDANKVVIDALVAEGKLLARGRLKHQYPHSWRSKKPVIFRNTPQWFISMDKDFDVPGGDGDTSGRGSLRDIALGAIGDTKFVPGAGQARLHAMIENRPDWVISRQRAWGVPITVFVHKETGELLRDPAVNARIVESFEAEGADAWFSADPSRFLGNEYSAEDYEQVTDILDVWFDSGSTHAFVLEQRDDLSWPASLYLEGTDQHRGWFHSSLLESCGTRGRAPYDAVLTHGFVMAEDGQKMSKSLGNITAPQDVCNQHGADILRLWVVGSNYSEDLRIGPEIVKFHADIYRRLRNTLRYLLGNLDGFDQSERLSYDEMPELERWVLSRLWRLDKMLRGACDSFEFHGVFTELHNFCAVDLSAFYFDIRKDTFYCDRADSVERRAARTVLDELFNCLTAWLAPFLCFTAEEAWQQRLDAPDPKNSVHRRQFPDIPSTWHDEALEEKWRTIRQVRRAVTGALELERAEKRIGASLQAHVTVHVTAEQAAALEGLDLPAIFITSSGEITTATAPDGAYTLAEAPGVAVVPVLADGEKCERCWKILPDVGSDADHPTVCARCADAVRHSPLAAE